MKESTASYLLIALFFFLGFVIKNPFILNMISIAALSVIVVLGLNLLLGYAGQVSLGHAGFVALGSYVSSILAIRFNINPCLSILMASLLTFVFALIVGYPTLKLKGHYLAMATLAIGEIIYIFANNLVDLTGGHQGLTGMPMLSVGSFVFDNERKFYFFVWIVVLIFAFLSFRIVNSHFGRALKAIHEKELAALSFGVNVHLYKVIIFSLSAFYAALAGGLYAFYIGFISPSSFDILQSINYVVMTFVGGIDSIFGSLVVTVVLASLPNILTFLQDYWPIVNGLLLVVAAMFMPKGLGGFVRWKRAIF